MFRLAVSALFALILALPAAAQGRSPVPLQREAKVNAQKCAQAEAPIPRWVTERYQPGTIIVHTVECKLYYYADENTVYVYRIGVGRAGFTWSGEGYVGNKRMWPDWTPPPEMIKREPHLPRHMAGGEKNPLGARALYIYRDVTDPKTRKVTRVDTGYRIHGTREPETIGMAVSSGCIRMYNMSVIELYELVQPGTRVVVL